MTSPHIEITNILLELLKKGGASGLPTFDFAVEAVRTTLLRDGVSGFMDLAKNTFAGRCRRAVQLNRSFFRRIRKLLGDLILSGQVDP